MNTAGTTEVHRRLEDRIHHWGIEVERLVETDSSVLACGRLDHESVVLKVVRNVGDEWFSGDVLDAFEGRGVVRALDYIDGALLLEQLAPGDSLVRMVVRGDDDQATSVLVDVIKRMSPRPPRRQRPEVQDWAQGFERHTAEDNDWIAPPLVEAAHRVYLKLCASQSEPRLLHGDLHHYNVLLDVERGWLAIDPKGIIGELEYEVGAALRNPCERPELFTEPATIERRVDCFARELQLDAGRILGWAFSQAVLAAIWELEDLQCFRAGKGWLALADAIRPMLRGVVDA